MVSVTFGLSQQPGFVVSVDQSGVRAILKTVTITDALDGSTLATKAY